jgi:hypothetical protein
MGYMAAVRALLLSAFFSLSWVSALSAEPPPTGERVVLRSRAIAPEALKAELGLRRPQASIVDFEGEGEQWSRAEAWTLVIVERSAVGFAVSVILSDGRAYDRVVEADSAQGARAVASTLANLIAAISEDRVAPDREAVTLESLESTTEEPPGPSDQPLEAHPSPPPPPAAAAPRPEAVSTPVTGAAPWSISPRVGGLALIGVGPPRESGALLGGGAALGIGARSPLGAIFGVDLRLLRRAAGELSLARVRVSFWAGYGLERGLFGVDLAGFVGIEGWSVRSMGERAAVLEGSDEAPSSALSAGLRVAPALQLPLGSSRRLRLGFVGEIGYAGVLDGGLRAARLSAPSTDGGADVAVFRVGGVELGLGLELRLRFDLSGRR